MTDTYELSAGPSPQIELHTALEDKLPYWFMKRVDKPFILIYPNRKCSKVRPGSPTGRNAMIQYDDTHYNYNPLYSFNSALFQLIHGFELDLKNDIPYIYIYIYGIWQMLLSKEIYIC